MRPMFKQLAIAWALLVSVAAQGQDLHFSQFFNSPLTTNPANTGFIPDGDYRLGANFRNQWSSVMTLPYKTMSAFGDMQVAVIRQHRNGADDTADGREDQRNRVTSGHD